MDQIECIEMTCAGADQDHNYGDPQCSYVIDRTSSTEHQGAEEITVRRKA